MNKLFMGIGLLATGYGIYSGIVGRVSTWSNHSSNITTYEGTERPFMFYLNVGIYVILGVALLVIAGRT